MIGIILLLRFSLWMRCNAADGCFVSVFLFCTMALAYCLAEFGALLWVVTCDEVVEHLCFVSLFVMAIVRLLGSFEILNVR